MQIMREGLRLGVLQAAVGWAFAGLPLAQALMVGWVAWLWSANLYVHAPLQRRPLGASFAVGAAAAAGLSMGLGGLEIWALLVAAVGVGLGRIRWIPDGADASTAETWARDHRDKYRGQGTGRKPLDTLMHDPYAGILGSSRRDPAPGPDPYEDALTVHVDLDKP